MPTCKEYDSPNGRPDKSGTITDMIPANSLAKQRRDPGACNPEEDRNDEPGRLPTRGEELRNETGKETNDDGADYSFVWHVAGGCEVKLTREVF